MARRLLAPLLVAMATITLGFVALAIQMGQTSSGFTDASSATVSVEAENWSRYKATYDLSACGTSTVTVPIHGNVTGTIEWGDGTTTPATDHASHTYDNTGTYTVTVWGTFDGLGSDPVPQSNACLIRVDDWSNTGTTSASNAFHQAQNLESVATPPSGITDMSYMFRMASSFNQDLTDWDTSDVTTMQSMFAYATSFNGDVSTWDTGSVTTMQSMFASAASFDGDISTWDTGGVTTMRSMFHTAESFNQDISGWDTGSVESMYSMFHAARSFNQPLPGWVTSRVSQAPHMFRRAESFNQDISDWDVTGISQMPNFFDEARAFNQDISGWDMSGVENVYAMFRYAESFNQDLSSWDLGSATSRSEFADGATAWALPKPQFP